MGVMKANDFIRGLVRAAEFKEQKDNGKIWDDECRNALDFARKLGWGKNKIGVIPHDVFCAALDTWAKLMTTAKYERTKTVSKPESPSEYDYHKAAVDEYKGFDNAWREIRMGITKSCLLDRMLNGGERPSQTPCPVHKGQWSGIQMVEQFTEPLSQLMAKVWGNPDWEGKTMIELGCRCNQHKCGCTTGWNVDEHCGCLEKKD